MFHGVAHFPIPNRSSGIHLRLETENNGIDMNRPVFSTVSDFLSQWQILKVIPLVSGDNGDTIQSGFNLRMGSGIFL